MTTAGQQDPQVGPGHALRIKSVNFANGPSLASPQLVVFVGPNNCGKTTALRDIYRCLTGHEERNDIVNSVEIDTPRSLDDAKVAHRSLASKVHVNDNTLYIRGLNETLFNARPENFHAHDFDRNPSQTFKNRFVPYLVCYLATELRLVLCAKAALDRTGSYQSDMHLIEEFYNGGAELERRFQQKFDEMNFGVSIKLDYSVHGILRFRVARDFSDIPLDQRDAQHVLSKFESLDEQGDGIRSFTSVLLAMVTEDRPFWLIHEPEAFLHPPQAYRMGRMLARFATDDRQVFVATHSADLLRGVLAENTNATIIRLVRSARRPQAVYLDPAIVTSLSGDPILSANRTLDALFYRASVVVEGDTDSLFYQRVAQQFRPNDDIHYVRAHNKQTLQKIMRPYRQLGIQAAAIVDFDILRTKSELIALAQSVTKDAIDEPIGYRNTIAAEIDEVSAAVKLAQLGVSLKSLIDKWPNPTENQEAVLEEKLREINRATDDRDSWKQAKRRGRGSLRNVVTAAAFDKLSRWFSDRGLFIVPVGEVES